MNFQCTEIRVGSVVVQGTGHSTGKQQGCSASSSPSQPKVFFYDSGKSLGAVFHSKSLTALYFFFFKKSNSKFSLNPGPVPHLSKSTATLRCYCQYGTELYLRQPKHSYFFHFRFAPKLIGFYCYYEIESFICPHHWLPVRYEGLFIMLIADHCVHLVKRGTE